MKTNEISWERRREKYVKMAADCAELNGCEKYELGEGMISLRNEAGDFYLMNTKSGAVRKISTAGRNVLVDDQDIDWAAVERECKKGWNNAQQKRLRYGGLSRWDPFKNGLCVLCWTLYPDGEYFMDSDGFGMEDNAEETIYGVIDTHLDFVEPFRPVHDVERYLQKLRA